MSARRCRCGKYAYASARAAWRAIGKVRRKPDAVPLQAYRCRSGCWHVRTAVDHRRRCAGWLWRKRRAEEIES